MSKRSASLRKQFKAFDQGRYIDSDGQESHCYNFYDWFCKDTSLKNKANTLFRASRRFVKKLDIDQDKHYVFFKNNCPMRGPLRDDFRICDKETGDVLFTVTPKTGCVEVWGSENYFSEALFEGHSLSSFYHMRGV